MAGEMKLNIGKWWETLSTELLAGAGSLGAYLEETGLTLAYVEKTLTGFKVRHSGRLLLEAGKMGELAPRLKENVAAWGLEASPVSLAVSLELGFFRKITLPGAAAENLPQVVAYELDRFLPLPGEHLYFDFQVLKETEGEIHLALMAVLKEPVEECLTLLTQASLRPVGVELGLAAAANAFATLAGRLPPSWLLLQLNPGVLEMAHIQGRGLMACGRLPAKDRELAAILSAEIQRLTAEGPEVKALGLYGPRAGNLEAAAASLDLDLAVLTPEQVPLPGLEPEADSAGALPAVGAALRGLGKVHLGANLLPPAERVGPSLGQFSLTKLLLVIFLALGLLWVGSLVVHKRVLLYQVNRALAEIAPEARQVEAQLEESRALARQLRSFRRMEQTPDKLRILKELTQIVPENTWLFNLRLSAQTLEISGMSRSASDLIPLLEKSGWLTKTEFASPIVTDATKLEHFKIKAEIKGLESAS
jgi:Tfp pilus assembly protein PilN